ncbi:MAG: cytochrome c [Candidatus Rokubacteria bacterium]|nr:cytochrome c [Candidatus Rokubacteria bacterium]
MSRFIVAGAVPLLVGFTVVAASRAQDRAALATRGEMLFRAEGCYGCHIVGKFGTAIGPNLSHVGAKYSRDYLTRWLRDPESVRPTAHMPKLELSPEQIDALVAYLSTLRG